MSLDREACPFCGSDDNKIKGAVSAFRVYCFKCGANGPVGISEQWAVRGWNTHAWHFHRMRLEALQEYQRELPEPHRTAVCNILANGKPAP